MQTLIKAVVLLASSGAALAQVQVTTEFSAGVDSVYSNPANWSNGVGNNTPTTTYHVILNSNPSFTLGQIVTVESLHLGTGGLYMPDASLTVFGPITATDTYDSWGYRNQRSLSVYRDSLSTTGPVLLDRVGISGDGAVWTHTGPGLTLEEIYASSGAVYYTPDTLTLATTYDDQGDYIGLLNNITVYGGSVLEFPSLTTLSSAPDSDFPGYSVKPVQVSLRKSGGLSPTLSLPNLTSIPDGIDLRINSGTVSFGALTDLSGLTMVKQSNPSGQATLEFPAATSIQGLVWPSENHTQAALLAAPTTTLLGPSRIDGIGTGEFIIDLGTIDSNGKQVIIQTDGTLILPSTTALVCGAPSGGWAGILSKPFIGIVSNGMSVPELRSIYAVYENATGGNALHVNPVYLNSRSGTLDLPNLSSVIVEPEGLVQQEFLADPFGFPLPSIGAESINLPNYLDVRYLSVNYPNDGSFPIRSLEYARLRVSGETVEIPTLERIRNVCISLDKDTQFTLRESTETDGLTVELLLGSELVLPETDTISRTNLYIEAPSGSTPVGVNKGRLTAPNLTRIIDSDITVDDPFEQSLFTEWVLDTTSEHLEIQNSNLNYVSLDVTSLAASGYFIGVQFPNLQTLLPAPGPFPTLVLRPGYRVSTTLDASSIDTIHAGVVLFINQTGRTIRAHHVDSQMVYGSGYLKLSGDLTAALDPNYDRDTLRAMLFDSANYLFFQFIGNDTQHFEIYLDEYDPRWGVQRPAFEIGLNSPAKDVVLTNNVENHDPTVPDAFRLRLLRLGAGSRLILNGHDATLYSYATTTDEPLADLIPEGQNCVGFENGLVCHQVCVSDVNRDGFTDNGDINAFLSVFLGGDPSADFNGDGYLDNGDISAFVGAFLAGC